MSPCLSLCISCIRLFGHASLALTVVQYSPYPVPPGEYIVSMGSLRWDTFCNAIAEKYSDLYWQEDLLVNLYEAVNGAKPGHGKV